MEKPAAKDCSSEYEIVEKPHPPAEPSTAPPKEPTLEKSAQFVSVERADADEDGATNPYSCIACNGTRVGPKGERCGECAGTGKIAEKLLRRIRLAVARELPPIQTRKAVKAHQVADSLRDLQARSIHLNTRCAACGTEPIMGVRYKCTKCPSYNLCEECEPLDRHCHPKLKLCEPTAETETPRKGGKYARFASEDWWDCPEIKPYSCPTPARSSGPATPS